MTPLESQQIYFLVAYNTASANLDKQCWNDNNSTFKIPSEGIHNSIVTDTSVGNIDTFSKMIFVGVLSLKSHFYLRRYCSIIIELFYTFFIEKTK